ncbi:MAG: MOSC N-terminal beta barrel domain-containing protein, partial [Pseudomonadota bacterium]
MSVMRVTALTCYPVKGLAGIQIRDCHLASAQLFSNDRRYALALDEQVKESWQGPLRRPWAKKRAFANLVNQPALARLAIAYASLESNLKICHEGKVLVQGCLQVADDCQRIAQAITAFVKTDKPFQLVEIDQKGQSANGAATNGSATSGSTTSGFTDSPYALLSLVNQASIEAIGRICGAQIDPARFRANIMI